MKKTLYVIIGALVIFNIFQACKKDNIEINKPVINQAIDQVAKTEYTPKCFTLKDKKYCRACMESQTEYCIARYDYATTVSNSEAGTTDKVITMADLNYVITHICDQTPFLAQVKDLPAGALDIVPGWNSFINEACETTWDNLTAIRVNNQWTFWSQLPEWTADPNDLDKQRFDFFWYVKTPSDWPEVDSLPYTQLEIGWYLLPVTDYGNTGLVCEGTQELVCWIKDTNTGAWYKNSLLSQASFLCNDAGPCENEYTVDQVQYANYQPGFLYYTEETPFD